MSEYIDRDAFLAHKRKLYCGDCDRRKGMKNGKMRILYDIGDVPCRACGIEDVLSDIEDFPEADVQPVVHGRWETEICDDGYGAYNLYVCSECGSESAKRFNYCRECGAKMSGGDA